MIRISIKCRRLRCHRHDAARQILFEREPDDNGEQAPRSLRERSNEPMLAGQLQLNVAESFDLALVLWRATIPTKK
jgi:hypothetical protein